MYSISTDGTDVLSTLLQQGIPTSLDGLVAQYGGAFVSFAVMVLTFVVPFLALYLVGRPILVGRPSAR